MAPTATETAPEQQLPNRTKSVDLDPSKFNGIASDINYDKKKEIEGTDGIAPQSSCSTSSSPP